MHSAHNMPTVQTTSPRANPPAALHAQVAEAPGGPLREWEGVQSTPRQVRADPQHPGRALFEPLAALTSLREPSSWVTLPSTALAPSSTTPVNGLTGWQLDLLATFDVPRVAMGTATTADFGLQVLAGAGFALNITLEVGSVAGWATLRVGPHAGPFPLPVSGPLTLRVLVDHSVSTALRLTMPGAP